MAWKDKFETVSKVGGPKLSFLKVRNQYDSQPRDTGWKKY